MTNPEIILPDTAVAALDEISSFDAFIKDFAFLRNVGIDPTANLYPKQSSVLLRMETITLNLHAIPSP
jgi:hypothetical protein